jgi:protocatechuate 3,4-dioxygenase beta subunit
MKYRIASLLFVLLPSLAIAAEPVIGGPCEGCELVFEGQPAQIEATARIAPAGHSGEPLSIEGVVHGRDGAPAAGILVYAYHTDADGVYPRADTRHGRLRGWTRTGSDGRYRFDTIRPAAYPDSSIPQHVHMHVIEPGIGTYYIDDVVFTDDPLLTAERRRAQERGRGGAGVCTPAHDDAGWHCTRDIALGAGLE